MPNTLEQDMIQVVTNRINSSNLETRAKLASLFFKPEVVATENTHLNLLIQQLSADVRSASSPVDAEMARYHHLTAVLREAHRHIKSTNGKKALTQCDSLLEAALIHWINQMQADHLHLNGSLLITFFDQKKETAEMQFEKHIRELVLQQNPPAPLSNGLPTRGRAGFQVTRTTLVPSAPPLLSFPQYNPESSDNHIAKAVQSAKNGDWDPIKNSTSKL